VLGKWIRRLFLRPDPCARPETEGQREASSALNRAEEARSEGIARREAVTDAAEGLRRLRRQNHFKEMFSTALEGKQ
jgi:hypothetical protein